MGSDPTPSALLLLYPAKARTPWMSSGQVARLVLLAHSPPSGTLTAVAPQAYVAGSRLAASSRSSAYTSTS